MSRVPAAGSALVVPVKRLAQAKTRLAEVAGSWRADLALAFASDTVRAALSCPRVAGVVVVTDEPRAVAELTALGAAVVADEPDAGLNPALAHGAAHAARLHPGTAIGALSADLPALRPGELSQVLAAAQEHPAAFLADAQGDGTTLLVARAAGLFHPEFGPASRLRHRQAGVAELAVDAESVRRDVDTPADLAAAVRLGVGPRTAQLLGRLPDRPGRLPDRPGRLPERTGELPVRPAGAVQATVGSFDAVSRSGTVLLDDGVELAYDADAFDAGQLRLARAGQRVRVEVEGERVRMLTHIAL